MGRTTFASSALSAALAGEHINASANLNAVDHLCGMTPVKVQQHEHHPESSPGSRRQRRVDVTQHELIQTERLSPLVEADAGPPVTEQEPP